MKKVLLPENTTNILLALQMYMVDGVVWTLECVLQYQKKMISSRLKQNVVPQLLKILIFHINDIIKTRHKAII